MSFQLSDDELPELSEIILAPHTRPRRHSPRKQSAIVQDDSTSSTSKQISSTAGCRQAHPSPCKEPQSPSPKAASRPVPTPQDIPALPQNVVIGKTTATSNNRRLSPSHRPLPLKLTHVNSLLLPLSKMALNGQKPEPDASRPNSQVRTKAVGARSQQRIRSDMRTSESRSSARESRQKGKLLQRHASRFVLSEARCLDDEEEESDEDEDTDLSGFIVDDDAELSYYDSSASESEDDNSKIKRTVPKVAPRKRLQRGSPTKRRPSIEDEALDSDKENGGDRGLSAAFRDMRLSEDRSKHASSREMEVIDLTSSTSSSPIRPPEGPRGEITSDRGQDRMPRAKGISDTANSLNTFDAVLKFSPQVPSKSEVDRPVVEMADRDTESVPDRKNEAGYKTPPATPPRSPSKLKSPSKLLSPSKRSGAIPRSPHRPSMDAFWDHHIVNEWHDLYSPKKVPVTSPRKPGRARFKIWSDSEDDSDNGPSRQGSTSSPSPCSSRPKVKSRSQSPSKDPEKAEKKRLADEKKAATARKKAFDLRKEQLAWDLLHELDTNVTGSQLGDLTASTGGIRVVWSKTLRSTAGRANWKRTVTKPSGSPIKGGVAEGAGIKVQHVANIELAEKVIDGEDRLVNTLAHEFCHLANFMISGIRDQPHGASFKNWAVKVTKHLSQSDNETWKKVEVTTKHSYDIHHKYLWVCVGRDRTKAMEFLNLDGDEGCGTEYGRHSKSIDPEKHRCGKCKGRLIQVRPKPRATASLVKRLPRKLEKGDSIGGLETMVETVELGDRACPVVVEV